MVNMPRHARKKSFTGIYHVLIRGINREKTFLDRSDFEKFVEIMARIKKETGFVLYGYCLMINHVHLLIGEGPEDISQIMKRIGTSYAMWFNKRHDRTGHLFQDRFRSECVEDDSYLLTVIRYIHQNPVKAGLVKNAEDYIWSSCRAYCSGYDNLPVLTDIDFILGLFGNDKEKSVKEFRKFTSTKNRDQCLEDNEYFKDDELRERIITIMSGKPIEELKIMSRHERNKIIREIKSIGGSSIRQLTRVTGIGFSIIRRA